MRPSRPSAWFSIKVEVGRPLYAAIRARHGEIMIGGNKAYLRGAGIVPKARFQQPLQDRREKSRKEKVRENRQGGDDEDPEEKEEEKKKRRKH